MRLHEIAHSRTGDKGSIVTISLIAYREKDFPILEREVTSERVAAHFQELIEGAVLKFRASCVSPLPVYCACLG